MKVLIATAERFAGCAVEALVRHGHQVVGLISPAMGVYRRQARGPRFWLCELRGWNVLRQCRKRKIPFRVSRHLEEGSISAFIRSAAPDLLLVFGWPTSIRPQTLALFPKGGVNIHPSLLPKLRGADPLFAIIDGEREAGGLTFHKIVEELDAGPTYLRQPLPVLPDDTYDRLYYRVLSGVRRALPRALTRLAANPAGEPQQGEPTEAPKFKRDFRILDCNQPPQRIWARTRACYSHHTMATSCAGQLLHFSRFRTLPRFTAARMETGVIVKAGWFHLEIYLGRQLVRLGGVRVDGKPWWMTPVLLRRLCAAGEQLAGVEETRALLRAARD